MPPAGAPSDRFALDLVAVGSAIVDVLSHAENETVAALGLEKGTMTLVDAARAAELYDRIGPAIEASGGSAANTAAGLASLGGRAAFLGKVADDQLGQVFIHDLRSTGVAFDVAPVSGSAPTAHCLVLVTPDAQRTMNTHLGIAAEIGAHDVDPSLLDRARLTFLEGYLIGVPAAEDALAKIVSSTDRVGLTLSDVNWVHLQHQRFMRLLPQCEVVFANEAEACRLYETDDVEKAASLLADTVPTAVVTRSAAGSIVLHQGERFDIPAVPVEHVVDTTGAGDLYAAGFLYGLARGASPDVCGKIGSVAAAEVISHFGARPQVELKSLLDPSWLR
jgi:sugar/nucleoside kinase (ribokinase family)